MSFLFFQPRAVLLPWSIEKAAHPAWILAHTWRSAAFVRSITWMAVSVLKASVIPAVASGTKPRALAQEFILK